MDSELTNTGAEPEDAYEKSVEEFSFLIRDKNHDGVLEREEFEEGRSDFDKQTDPERFERYDLDGDGLVTREEFMLGRAADREVEASGFVPPGSMPIEFIDASEKGGAED